MFTRKHKPPIEVSDPFASNETAASGNASATPENQSTEKEPRLPHHNTGLSNKSSGWIKEEGHAGRSGFHPWHFVYCIFYSSCTASMVVNFLWPVVPAAIAVHFIWPDHESHSVLVFTLNYIAMVPAANTIGYAGQMLGRKLPHVFGVLVETTLGSVVEIVFFSVLVSKGQIEVVRAAILGSMLANLLFCLGAVFVAGGLLRHDQEFHEVVSEVGSGLLSVAGFGLVIPVAFATALGYSAVNEMGVITNAMQEGQMLSISRATAILLLLAYFSYLYFNMSSHHSIVTEVLEGDEANDNDRHLDLLKRKLTLFECILALAISITCVSIIAVSLVEEIPAIVDDHGISDAFMGLILVPLVEKFAEHITAIDEAYDNMPNLALAHVLGASIQTALLNTPLVVIVGWGLGEEMDLNFKQFEAIVLILTIFVVGNFLRDGKSNYLEGVLLLIIYTIIAVCAWYYPNKTDAQESAQSGKPARMLLMKG